MTTAATGISTVRLIRIELLFVQVQTSFLGKPRNTSSSRRSPFEAKWSDRKAARHSPAASEERQSHSIPPPSATAAVGTVTPTPDDRKSGDSG